MTGRWITWAPFTKSPNWASQMQSILRVVEASSRSRSRGLAASESKELWPAELGLIFAQVEQEVGIAARGSRYRRAWHGGWTEGAALGILTVMRTGVPPSAGSQSRVSPPPVDPGFLEAASLASLVA